MVSNSAKLDHRTKQHTQFGVSASNGSRDIGWTKLRRKKKEKKRKKKNEHRQNYIASPTGIANNETGSRSPCMRPRSDPPKMKNSNVVRSRLIILISKQHTQFGVSASNSSRDMALTKSWRKKRKKLRKKK